MSQPTSSPYTPAPQKPKKRWPWIVGAVVVAVLVFCGIGTALIAAAGDPAKEVNSQPAAPVPPATSGDIRANGGCSEPGRVATAVGGRQVRCDGSTWQPVVEAPTTTTAPAKPPPPAAVTIDEGIWTVGEDVPPGTYKVIEKADGMCYWARLRPNGDIIANHIGGGLPKVTIRKGEVFETSSCPTWKRVG